MAEAERILCQLRDVKAASITTDGDAIKEIHIVAVSTRSPKNIVRDVETSLKAFLKRPIDHRMISVALQVPDEVPEPKVMVLPPPPEAAGRRVEPVAPPPAAESRVSRPESTPTASGSRVRFMTANLFVTGLRTQAEVELSWQGMTRLGNATGASARDNAHRLLSTATLNALAPYLGEDVMLAPHEVEFVRLGRQEVVVVTVKLLSQRSEKTLVGSCTVEQDVAQSVVYATLAAVNRVLGGLRSREPVEYE
ncbi:MAG: hypothetical protein ABI960_08600, partial [Candidatus Eisenbacteria bacterium]